MGFITASPNDIHSHFIIYLLYLLPNIALRYTVRKKLCLELKAIIGIGIGLKSRIPPTSREDIILFFDPNSKSNPVFEYTPGKKFSSSIPERNDPLP